MKLLYVPLSREILSRLETPARRERRRVQDQTTYLPEKALEELAPEREEGKLWG